MIVPERPRSTSPTWSRSAQLRSSVYYHILGNQNQIESVKLFLAAIELYSAFSDHEGPVQRCRRSLTSGRVVSTAFSEPVPATDQPADQR